MKRWMFPLLLVAALLLPGVCSLRGADETVLSEIKRLRDAADELTARGLHGEAEMAYSVLIKQCEEAIGADHSTTLDVRFRRALAIMDQGRVMEAERTSRELLRDATRILGPDAEQTLNIRDGHAAHLYFIERKDEARSEWHAVLEAQARVFGPYAKSSISVRSNLAAGLVTDGKHEEALPELRLMVAARQRVFGEQARETLDGRFSLGSTLVQLGRIDEAREEFRLVTVGRAALLGETDSATLQAREMYARMLEGGRDFEEMLIQLRKHAEGCEKAFGPDAEKTLMARNYVATALGQLGREAEREQVARGVLAAAEGKLRPENRAVLVARLHLIESRKTPKNLDDTEVAYRLLLGDMKRGLGTDDRETLLVQQKLWAMVYAAGRPLDIEDIRSMVAARTRLQGADHLNTQSGRRLLVAALMQKKRFAEAEAILRDIMRVEEKEPGLALLEVYRLLAACLGNQDKEEEGLIFARRAYDGALKTFGDVEARMKPYAELVKQFEAGIENRKIKKGAGATKAQETGEKPASP